MAAVNAGASGLLHLTASGACSWHEFTTAIMQQAGIDVPVHATSTEVPPGGTDRPLNGVLARPRADAMGLSPLRPWREALADYMDRAGPGEPLGLSGQSTGGDFHATPRHPSGRPDPDRAPKVLGDERGFFVETYRRSTFSELGIAEEMVQDNHSRSRHGIVRGMHFQIGKGAAKLVRAGRGAIYDVVVDVRVGSPTFGQWEGFELTEENMHVALLPDRVRARLLRAQ